MDNYIVAFCEVKGTENRLNEFKDYINKFAEKKNCPADEISFNVDLEKEINKSKVFLVGDLIVSVSDEEYRDFEALFYKKVFNPIVKDFKDLEFVASIEVVSEEYGNITEYVLYSPAGNPTWMDASDAGFKDREDMEKKIEWISESFLTKSLAPWADDVLSESIELERSYDPDEGYDEDDDWEE